MVVSKVVWTDSKKVAKRICQWAVCSVFQLAAERAAMKAAVMAVQTAFLLAVHLVAH